jgi:hypothetical protein
MIKNYTPHEVVVYDNDGPRDPYPSCGVARVREIPHLIMHADGIPVLAFSYGEVTGLPDQRPGVFYIVSAFVRKALPYRRDLLSLDTGIQSAVRNDDGVIIGVRRFIGS